MISWSEIFGVAVVGIAVVFSSLVFILFLTKVNTFVASGLNRIFKIDTPSLKKQRDKEAFRKPSKIKHNEVPAHDEELVAVISAAASAAVGQPVKLLGFSECDQENELIAVLSAAAMVALDAPVNVLKVDEAKLSPCSHSWVQYGWQNQMLKSDLRSK